MSLPQIKTDQKDFIEMIKGDMTPLRHYCTALTGSEWDGEDLLQETLIKAYRSWNLTPKEMNKAFLFRVASNTWIDHYRKCRIEVSGNPEALEKEQSESFRDDALLSQGLTRVLRVLTAKQRTVFLLVEGFGFDSKTVAEMLHSSEGAIKAALHRARKTLHRHQTSFSEEEEGEEVLPYTQAIINGQPETIVTLYKQEIEPQMSMFSLMKIGNRRTHRDIFHIQINHLMVLSWVSLDGQFWMVPFNRGEWMTLLGESNSPVLVA
ncbi:RNA polymerase sigma-70 factor (ECF subfamily) [Pullulanibacillus pueri]|uniref:RNA polymerase sigma factor n=1 Tax=Pullulanibacillus pueri TaxID=1437324 RepID=A0A8J3EKB9_9BACL|nr:RNA polymerase sigma factor [Pullulanibacillus pueri]MBM7680359.1 RNA polymerase sigma-70 factor (ECF subfamily) [Pullulanibacillus pueri]GGH75463.1 hypothetical protein GCM10007096_04720 [Pullulanibacillus pueri]